MHLDLQSETQLWIGTFEREVSGWLRRFSRGIVTGIDVGAGHGEYTLFLLAKTSAQRVVAFEPDAKTIASLRANLSLNELGESNRLVLFDRFVGGGQSHDEMALDALPFSITGPCLVKIDVEGREASVLRGARRLLVQEDLRLIVETHCEEAERDCMALLQDAGYRMRVVSQGWWRGLLPENRPSPHNRWLVAWKE
jgi:hypothetical protein